MKITPAATENRPRLDRRRRLGSSLTHHLPNSADGMVASSGQHWTTLRDASHSRRGGREGGLSRRLQPVRLLAADEWDGMYGGFRGGGLVQRELPTAAWCLSGHIVAGARAVSACTVGWFGSPLNLPAGITFAFSGQKSPLLSPQHHQLFDNTGCIPCELWGRLIQHESGAGTLPAASWMMLFLPYLSSWSRMILFQAALDS